MKLELFSQHSNEKTQQPQQLKFSTLILVSSCQWNRKTKKQQINDSVFWSQADIKGEHQETDFGREDTKQEGGKNGGRSEGIN